MCADVFTHVVRAYFAAECPKRGARRDGCTGVEQYHCLQLRCACCRSVELGSRYGPSGNKLAAFRNTRLGKHSS